MPADGRKTARPGWVPDGDVEVALGEAYQPGERDGVEALTGDYLEIAD